MAVSSLQLALTLQDQGMKKLTPKRKITAITSKGGWVGGWVGRWVGRQAGR